MLETLKGENSTLKATIEAMETRLAAGPDLSKYALKEDIRDMNNLSKLAKVNYTFSKTSDSMVRYDLGQTFQNSPVTLYINYTETKDNVESEKQIKVLIIYDKSKIQLKEFLFEPEYIYLGNTRQLVNEITFVVMMSGKSINLHSIFFQGQGFKPADNSGNEIFTRTPYATLLDIK